MTLERYAGLLLDDALALAAQSGTEAEVVHSAQPRGNRLTGQERVVRAFCAGGKLLLTVCQFEETGFSEETII